MAAISQATVARYIASSRQGGTTAEQGRALEDMMCYVFSKIPGVSVNARNTKNAFRTEEIDIALWNNTERDGLYFLPNILLVECKNWSNVVTSAEVSWFDRKIVDHGLDFGILVAAQGITGDPQTLSAAHFILATALRDRRRIVIIDIDEIRALRTSTAFVALIQRKLCELVLLGQQHA